MKAINRYTTISDIFSDDILERQIFQMCNEHQCYYVVMLELLAPVISSYLQLLAKTTSQFLPTDQ